MTPDLFDELETNLRTALHAVVPHLLDEQPDTETGVASAPPSLVTMTSVRTTPAGHRARVGTMAAALVLLLGAATMTFALTRQHPAVGDPAKTSTVATAATSLPTGTLTCTGGQCFGFDPLPLAAGVGNYFTGPADLGPPHVDRDLYNQLTRCSQLNATYTECAKIQGMAGVSVVSYPLTGSAQPQSIDIGTTFTEVTPQQYAEAWGPTSHTGTTSPVVVRGHQGVRYLNEDRPAVVWKEASGVLVWVAVPATSQDRLLTIAEGVRSSPEPVTTIPNVVQVTIDGATATAPAVVHAEPAWNAHNNSGRGLLVGRAGGAECVGYDFIKSCGQTIGDRTFVTITRSTTGATDETLIAGATPTGVESVRITLTDGRRLTASTVTFANYASRFYDVKVVNAYARTIEWLDAGGQAVASTNADSPVAVTTVPELTVLPPADPSGSPSVFDTGANVIVFIHPGASPQQIELIQNGLSSAVSSFGTLERIEYLDSQRAMAEARRVSGREPPGIAALPGITPESTPTLFRIWVKQTADGPPLHSLALTLMQLPNVGGVWTSDTSPNAGGFPLYGTGPAPGTTLAPVPTP